MDGSMAPPHKRLKLSSSASQYASSQADRAVIDPVPTLSHSVETLEHNLESAATRTVPHHVEELHLQIRERAISSRRHQQLHRRQLISSVESVVNAAGDTVLSTVTLVGQGTSISSTAPSASSASTSSSGSPSNGPNATSNGSTSTSTSTLQQSDTAVSTRKASSGTGSSVSSNSSRTASQPSAVSTHYSSSGEFNCYLPKK